MLNVANYHNFRWVFAMSVTLKQGGILGQDPFRSHGCCLYILEQPDGTKMYKL